MALPDIKSQKSALLKQGVYFLHEGEPKRTAFDPYSPSVVYIGKAIGETIFSRCHKHCAALLDERLSSGLPSMRPGKNFKAYRAVIGGSLHNLYVIPGFMSSDEPYLISCAEEYLLHKYLQRHGQRPRANTK